MIIDIILISCLIITIARIIFFLIGAIIERRKGLKLLPFEQLPNVSVVVPARNEEINISNCIKSIAESDYPQDKFEIIVVNDRSTDNTLRILNDLKKIYSNLKTINKTENVSHHNLQGKPGALQLGIDNAEYDIILMTDADCVVHPKWIRSISSFFNDEEMGLVAGYTAIKGNKPFEKIQSVEWTYLHTLATAGIGFNMPLSCYGNNIAVRKKYFDEIGGYRSVNFSVTEDLALLHAMHKSGKKLRHLTHKYATVTTLACTTLKEYFKQHHRWIIGALDLGFKAFIWVITSFVFWVGLVSSIITLNSYWLIVFLSIRIIGDALITLPTARILNIKKMTRWMIPAVLFFLFMELVAPFFLLKKDVNWKGQIFK